jgi:hypothetical protein
VCRGGRPCNRDPYLCIYWCFALPQFLYRWWHQSGIFWVHPRMLLHIVGQEWMLHLIHVEVIRGLLMWQLWFNVTFIFFLATSCPGYLDITCNSAISDMRTDFQFFLISFPFYMVQWTKVSSLTFLLAVSCF